MLGRKTCALAALLPCLSPAAAPGGEAQTVGEALRQGTSAVTLRYRYENVGDDAVGDNEARASTLRTTLGYETGSYRGWSLFLEAENVADLGAEDLHNNAGAGSLDNGVRDRPVVADPALTELNQVYLQYRRSRTTLRLGREELTIGDHRFVGNVGWRQNHQSFDAFTLITEPTNRWVLSYRFVDNVNRIFGDSKEMSSHLLDAEGELGEFGELRLYGYLLDYRRPQDALLSTATVGAELAGKRRLNQETELLWEIEYARQSDWEENPRQVDSGYLHALLGVALARVTVKLGWEVLDGSERDGQLNTPLATLHKFNGWADKFLTTPTDGLEDLYLAASGDAGRIGWTVVYHDFSAASGGSSYGSELDLELAYTAPWKQKIFLTAALYDADAFAADTDKWMVWTTYGF